MRRPRLDLPNIPQHLTHRGVNRAATFLDEDDYGAYLQALDACARQHNVLLHGYVLMTNHVHLLVSAPVAGSISRMMQAIGRRYVRAFNARHGRTGTLWEGRYKSCLVDGDRYLLACLRYIELNPLRAAMVVRAQDYRWSSVHAHLGLLPDHRLSFRAEFMALGRDSMQRAYAWQQLLDEAISADEIAALRDYVRQERAYGSARFQSMVEKTLNRPVVVRPPGRPPRSRVDSNANVL